MVGEVSVRVVVCEETLCVVVGTEGTELVSGVAGSPMMAGGFVTSGVGLEDPGSDDGSPSVECVG